MDRARLDRVDPFAVEGRVVAVSGLAVRAVMPSAALGAIVSLERNGAPPVRAEVVGFDEAGAVLLPLEDVRGLGPGDVVRSLDSALTTTVSEGLLGRVVNGFGVPVDDGPPLRGHAVPLRQSAPPALSRPPIEAPFVSGVRALDTLTTLGVGGRVGIFAGSGVGKTSLLESIVRGSTTDVVVFALVGERSREVREAVDVVFADAKRERSVVVAATAGAGALERAHAAETAMSIAEFFRDRGRQVLLVIDSLSRVARACREVGLAAGEPPLRRGYPPSVFAALSALLERGGTSALGAITTIATVLVEADDDLDDPVADEVRGLVDGHIVLDRTLFSRGRRPAIDLARSISRVMPRVISQEHQRLALSVTSALLAYDDARELLALGAYKPGSSRLVDRARQHDQEIEDFLNQPTGEVCSYEESTAALRRLAALLEDKTRHE